MRQLLHIGALLIVSGVVFASAGDIFAYIDAAGVTHFSNVPNDPRYSLLIAGAPDQLPPATAGKPARPAVDWLARSARFDAAIDGAARANTIQPALVRAVIVVESGFNPSAVSKKGAAGLMQLRPETARRYGVQDVFNPEQNIRAGAHYLRDLLNHYGSNMELALAAYNAGEDAVEHYGRRIPPFRETLDYVPNVLAVYRKLLTIGATKHDS
jgi:soluble lytic murein transglycosylase-like protein